MDVLAATDSFTTEVRTIQDWHVRYALASARGVAEVASIGGFVREYQVDVDPDAMRAFGVSIGEVVRAVRMSILEQFYSRREHRLDTLQSLPCQWR